MSHTLPSRIWLRIPITAQTLGILAYYFNVPGYTRISALDPLVADIRFVFSMRFRNTAGENLPATTQVRMASRLAYVFWRLNQWERWFGLPPTDFKLRDRITHAKYSLDTAPAAWAPTGDWYSAANLLQLLNLVRDQIRQYGGGGPSGQGASFYYVQEYLAQARLALAAIWPTTWAAPPNGPGLGGVLFGGNFVTLNDAGNRIIPLLGQAGGLGLAGGGAFPTAPANTVPRTNIPWDYGGAQAPTKATHYLPIERLKPDPVEDPEVYRGWNAGYFERLKYRRGITENANRWPPDYQILSEFNLDPGVFDIVNGSIIGTGETHLPSGLDTYTVGFGKLKTVPDPTNRVWSAARPFDSGVASSLPARVWDVSHIVWPINPGGWITIPAASLRRTIHLNDSQIHGFHTDSFNYLRLGVEQDINGLTWRLSIFDWLSIKLGAVPDKIRVKGTLTLNVTSFWLGFGTILPFPYSFVAKFSLGPDVNDEVVARKVEKADTLPHVIATTPAAGNLPAWPPGPTFDFQSIAFDVDLTDWLRDEILPWYLAITIDPPHTGPIRNNGGLATEWYDNLIYATLESLALVAKFGDQEVVVSP